MKILSTIFQTFLEINMKPGTLHLIPAPLGEIFEYPHYLKTIIEGIDYFIVENEKSARKTLSLFVNAQFSESRQYAVLDEHTPVEAIPNLLNPILHGKQAGLLSEAGLPCIADPGAALITAAHKKHITIIPHPGPSSLFMALMASGLNGQRFMFDGYLPIEHSQRIKRLKFLEQISLKEHMSIGCIETPYRNQKLFEALKQNLNPETRLCIASGLMTHEESIQTKRILDWNQSNYTLPKVPAVFFFQA